MGSFPIFLEVRFFGVAIFMLYPIINVIISSFVAIKVDIFEYVGRGFYDQDMDDYIDKFFIVWYHIGHRSEDIWYELQTG